MKCPICQPHQGQPWVEENFSELQRTVIQTVGYPSPLDAAMRADQTISAISSPPIPANVGSETTCASTPSDTMGNEDLAAQWARFARYHLTLSADGDWNDKTVVAEWLTLDAVTALVGRLNRHLDAKRGRNRRWGDGSYSFELVTPPIRSESSACVGDLILHKRVVETGPFNLSGFAVIREFLLAGVVTAVGPGGLIAAYRDRDGDHTSTPKKPKVISSEHVDVTGVIQAIAVRERTRGRMAGEFSNTDALQPILVRYQRIRPPLVPQTLLDAA